jgi:hypothetical protein
MSERFPRDAPLVRVLSALCALEAIEDAADARAADEAKAEGGALPLTEFLNDQDSEDQAL